MERKSNFVMPKIYLQKNVLEAAFERLEIIFNDFDNVYFSVSAGKDSSVMVQLANMVAKRLNKKFDILFIDLEGQYKNTIDHVYELKKLSQVKTFYHIALPIALRNAVSVLQPKWICWEEESKHLWIRGMPKDSINIHNCPFKWFKKGQEFEEFVLQFANWYKQNCKGKVACGIGIRTDESLNRFRTITFQKNKETYKNYNWTTRIKYSNKVLDVYNFYPIYDFKVEDIWGTVCQFNFHYNKIYDLMYKNGVPLADQRICQPYGDDQRRGLNQFKALEYQTWEKVLNRVNGVNFGNIYCRTFALGDLKTSKPNFMSWQQYTVFLLESIGIYNKKLEKHYAIKIKKFFQYWEEKCGCTLDMIEDEADKKMESLKIVPSWRRVARALERNDFFLTRLSFGETKSDVKYLKEMIYGCNNLYDENSCDSKPLRRLYNKVKEEMENEKNEK